MNNQGTAANWPSSLDWNGYTFTCPTIATGAANLYAAGALAVTSAYLAY